MQWVQVLTGFHGRRRRRDFWIGLLFLLLIEIVLFLEFSAGIIRPTGATELERATGWLALAILLWVSAALIVKRLHDRDKPALWYPLFGLAPAFCYQPWRGLFEQHLERAQSGAALLLAAHRQRVADVRRYRPLCADPRSTTC